MIKWTLKEEEKLKKLYSKTNFSVEKISKIINRSVPSLSNRLTKMKVKRRNLFKCKIPSKITPALARIHAHVCGDGCIYTTQGKECGPWAKYRKKLTRTTHMIAFSNNNQDLLKEFKEDIYEVFNLKARIKRNNQVKLKSKKVWSFLKEMGAGGSYDWSVPLNIINGPQKIAKNWIRAFFDDEAYFNDRGRIRVKCVNKKGMQQLTKMVNRFIPCNLMPKKGFYWGNTVCLSINRKNAPKFFSKIGSVRYKCKSESRLASKVVS